MLHVDQNCEYRENISTYGKTYKSYYGICEVNRDIRKIRKTFHHTPCLLIKWMRFLKNNEKGALGFRLALSSWPILGTL